GWGPRGRVSALRLEQFGIASEVADERYLVDHCSVSCAARARVPSGQPRRPTRIHRAPTPTGDSGAAASHQVHRPAAQTWRLKNFSGGPLSPRQEGATESQIRIARSATEE